MKIEKYLILSVIFLIGSSIYGCRSYEKNQLTANFISTQKTIEQSQEIASWLEGKMETSIPGRNSLPKKVIMTTCRVKLDDNQSNFAENSIFLYQEQAMSDKLSSPYRQRFLQIKPLLETNKTQKPTTLSISFKPSKLQTWNNFCDKTASKRIVKSSQIGEKVCSVIMNTQNSNNTSNPAFIGKTPENGCPVKSRGAVRITNLILLRKTSMETWDRGFDSQGKQVWGAKNKPYLFRKVI